MNLILENVKKYISDNHMLPAGTHVVAGVSGGADSMCLLFVLMKLQEPLGLKLCAVHIHHGIRGEAADKDQKFVENFCESHGILWKTYQGDIPAMARREKISEEEAGRRFRYDCFNRALSELGWSDGRIAVAHNKNDVAETFLMNIFRGSGLYGLASIPPVRDNIIRPLLSLERREIEALLGEAGIGYCTDGTNLENDYTRNKLRNELIPYISEQINPRAVEHMYDLACEARELGRFMGGQSTAALTGVTRADGSLDVYGLQAMEPLLVHEVLRLKIEAVTGKLKDITRRHIEQAAGLLEKSVGKEVHLPYGLTVRRGYDRLSFCVAPERGGGAQADGAPPIGSAAPGTVRAPQISAARPGTDGAPPAGNVAPRGQSAAAGNFSAFGEIILEIPGNTGIISSAVVPPKGLCIELALKDVPADAEFFERIKEKQCTKWLDYDKIKNGLKLRHRRSGDYMVVDQAGSHKLLRRLMIDEKIPREERDKVWLIADGSHIVWMVGGRISEACKITSQTKKVLEIKIKGEE